MVSRGVHQLKHIRLYFCDFGGSSVGVRDLLKSEELAKFIEKNEHLKLQIYLKRGHHPYMSSTYINGYVKDQPLRNMEGEEVLDHFDKFNNALGRSALQHNSNKVMTSKPSIQGEWRDNLWQQYPKHMLETVKEIPYTIVEADEPNEIKVKKVKPHVLTTYLRRKFPIPQYNKNM